MSLRVSLCVGVDRDCFLIQTNEALEVCPRDWIKRSENSSNTIGEETLNEIACAITGLCHGKAA